MRRTKDAPKADAQVDKFAQSERIKAATGATTRTFEILLQAIPTADTKAHQLVLLASMYSHIAECLEYFPDLAFPAFPLA